jgi:hypothetical protein
VGTCILKPSVRQNAAAVREKNRPEAQEIALIKRWNMVEINGQLKCDWSEKVGAFRATTAPVQNAAGKKRRNQAF